MQMILFPIILLLSLLFTRLTHPLSTGIILLLQTVLVSLTSGIYLPSFWFSYILFLIFLGGMLVLFIYITSLASNEPFSVSMTATSLIVSTSMILSAMFMMTDSLLLQNFSTNLHHMNFFKNQETLTSTLTYTVYNFPASNLTLFIIMYLLLTLIVVVFIVSVSFGPLRLSK